MSIDELPQSIRPANGWVQNCNDAPQYCGDSGMTVPPPYPTWLAPDLRTLRGVRLAALLGEAGASVTPESAMEIAMDTKDLNAARQLPDLIRAADQAGSTDATVAECAWILSLWDGELRAESRGAALFQAWLMQPAIASRLSVGSWVAPDYAGQRPIAQVDPASAVRALRDAADWLRAYDCPLDVEWGELHRLKRGSMEFPMDGGLDSLCPNGGRVDEATGKVSAAFGSSYHCIAVPNGEATRLWACLPWGNSDDPASPHFFDQAPIAARRGYRDVPWKREAVEAEAIGRVEL